MIILNALVTDVSTNGTLIFLIFRYSTRHNVAQRSVVNEVIYQASERSNDIPAG